MSTGPRRLELLDDVGFLLSRSSGAAIRATNEQLRSAGIRARHYSVLSLACDTEGVSQRELADVLGLDPSQIVALVDDLQKRGLVERHPDPGDRRTRLVSPTPHGRTVLRRARGQVAKARNDFLGRLDDGERAVLLELLRKVAVPDQVEAATGGGTSD